MARMPKKGSITSPYGTRVNPITGVKKLHAGVDIGGGGTIVAPMDLTITHEGANLNKQTGYGYWIRGRDKNGCYHLFAHMTAPSSLNPGQKVAEGGKIGVAGETGGATGVHLHWGVSTGIEAGWEDPINYINSQIKKPTTNSNDVDRVAREVIAGKWGNGNDRKKRLEKSGYNYAKVQARVNEILDKSSTSHRTYTVQKGDTLSGIARRLNYAGGWKALYNRNRGIIGKNPNLIRPGQVLSL